MILPIPFSTHVSWPDGSSSDEDEEHTLGNISLCSSALHVCGPLLQETLHAEELCEVALTCRLAFDLICVKIELWRLRKCVDIEGVMEASMLGSWR